MKCDKLKAEQWLDYSGEPMPCYPKANVDAAIAELKAAHHKERDEYISMVYSREQTIKELKKKLEDAQASAYAESVDAGMENRRLKRALWIARAELCRRLDVDRYLRKHINSWYNENCLTWAEACVAMEVKMCKAESKCRAKAEEY